MAEKLKEAIESIDADINSLQEIILQYLPNNELRPLILGQLMTTRKLIALNLQQTDAIPSIRSRLRATTFAKEDAPNQGPNNGWAANLPERPDNPAAKPKLKKQPKVTVNKDGLPIQERGLDDVEIHEVPGNTACVHCGGFLVDHHEDKKFPEHEETGLHPVRGCSGDVYYLV